MLNVCTLPIVAGWIAFCSPEPNLTAGYVEGDYLKLAPVELSEIADVKVEEGELVKKGQLIAVLVESDANMKLAEAKAQLQQTLSSLKDLKLGKRPEEIEVLKATLRSAQAQAQHSQNVYDRYQGLLGRNVISQAQFDEAETALLVAQARTTELQAQLSVAKLPAREDQIAAAESLYEMAKAKVDLAEWLLEKRKIYAPENAKITDIFLHKGEMAGPSAPVASLLPDTSVKLHFFVPEEQYSQLKLGAQFNARCSGCTTLQALQITHIAEGPEFTPPVIYSLEAREKLVYEVQAKPVTKHSPLRPGQIFDVNLDSLR
ncbi:Multidrug export protein EmrA [Pseudovibrio axinellae]|uniref:Multidrug export protein EmrA n=1 Tax=Pseudovibrio axinellae TaxID=989403 RepID=A0A165SWL3_9HYPH|nr:HlyD family efflux transporter periplasmic adaptor subunit [Pseudovibrio axinellae]KZL04576.1 Multidrug export protein EmrA [Pseudovibrio axinellae]SEQ72512.1 HlyD family secretion protein [Pseudovibrio axinellae]